MSGCAATQLPLDQAECEPKVRPHPIQRLSIRGERLSAKSGQAPEGAGEKTLRMPVDDATQAVGGGIVRVKARCFDGKEAWRLGAVLPNEAHLLGQPLGRIQLDHRKIGVARCPAQPLDLEDAGAGSPFIQPPKNHRFQVPFGPWVPQQRLANQPSVIRR